MPASTVIDPSATTRTVSPTLAGVRDPPRDRLRSPTACPPVPKTLDIEEPLRIAELTAPRMSS